MKKYFFILCVGWGLHSGMAWGQSDRYELGQHLQAFEATFEQFRDKEASRKRAVAPLWKATPYFFALRWGEAAKALDAARHALISREKPNPEIVWGESVFLELDKRLLDTSADFLGFQVKSFYQVDPKMPQHSQLRLTLSDRKGRILVPAWTVPINKIPQKGQWKLTNLPEGDHTLRIEIRAGGKPLTTEEQGLSFVANLDKRWTALNKGVRALSADKSTVDSETVHELKQLLSMLMAGRTLETDYPAARLFREAESVLSALQANQGYYGPDKTGQFWLRLPLKKESVVSRVFIPEEAKKKNPLPLVVALHGAGTSENMFFEAYGRGKIVDLCRKRGWLLISPRSPTFAFRRPVTEIVDTLARRYPVDKTKVLVIGHSMGAAQAVAAVQDHPDRFAAIAALAGSGRVKDSNKIKHVPFFVAVGNRDFALEGTRRLADSLRKAGVQNVQFKEYPQIEHVTIVQVALPEVFAFFEKCLGK